MKTTSSLLLAGAVALGFTLNAAAADEPFLSPRGKANQIKRAVASDTGPNRVSGNYLGAAAKLEAHRLKVVPSGGATPNLVSGNYNSAALKAHGGTPSSQFEIAPLVGKDKSGKVCEPGCTKPCCAKK